MTVHRFAVAAALVLAAAAAYAADAQDSIPAADVVAAAKRGCVERLVSGTNFKDPASVKVLLVERRGPYYLGTPKTPTRVYLITANGKNSYGAYAGEKDYFCHVDPTNERIVVLVVPTSY